MPKPPESLARPDYPAAAAAIAAHHAELIAGLKAHARSGRDAIGRAIAIGHQLEEVRSKLRGQFDDWIAAYNDSTPDFPSRTRCYDFLRLAQIFPTLDDIPLEADSINRALLLAGAIARREPGEIVDRPEPPAFRLTYKLPENDPREWAPEVRTKFLENAKPIVELYHAALALT